MKKLKGVAISGTVVVVAIGVALLGGALELRPSSDASKNVNLSLIKRTPIRVVLYGSTGNVGGNILKYLESDPYVESIVVVGRSEISETGEKVTAVRQTDFLGGYQAALDKVVSSTRVDAVIWAVGSPPKLFGDAREYSRVHVDMPIRAAQYFKQAQQNPPTFHYVSGAFVGENKAISLYFNEEKGRAERLLSETIDESISYRSLVVASDKYPSVVKTILSRLPATLVMHVGEYGHAVVNGHYALKQGQVRPGAIMEHGDMLKLAGLKD